MHVIHVCMCMYYLLLLTSVDKNVYSIVRGDGFKSRVDDNRLDGKYLSKVFIAKVDEFIMFACAQEEYEMHQKLKWLYIKCRNIPYLDVDTVSYICTGRAFVQTITGGCIMENHLTKMKEPVFPHLLLK